MAARRWIFSIVVLPWASIAWGNDHGDATSGKKIYRQCATCHQIGPDAKNRIGPHLNALFGRAAAGIDGFRYSPAMQRAGSNGLTWTGETLNAYIENPKALVTGTRMNFSGVRDEADRLDLLAFLESFSDNPSDLPEAASISAGALGAFEIAPEILNIEGDPAYGQYLAGECTTCHQDDGSDEGIPSITGWPAEDVVVALHAYREKIRPHPVMQMISSRLSDNEIAALAAYFSSIE